MFFNEFDCFEWMISVCFLLIFRCFLLIFACFLLILRGFLFVSSSFFIIVFGFKRSESSRAGDKILFWHRQGFTRDLVIEWQELGIVLWFNKSTTKDQVALEKS